MWNIIRKFKIRIPRTLGGFWKRHPELFSMERSLCFLTAIELKFDI
jgi:hypothetical protein